MPKKAVIIAVLCFSILPLAASADGGSKSLSAYNITQGVSAQLVPANAGDSISFTLVYVNDASSSQSVTMEDDITDVLYSSDLVNPGGASLVGNTLRYPAVSAPAWGRVEKSFTVQVKQLPAGTLDTLISNTFGTSVDIKVNVAGGGAVKGAYVAPKTGPADNLALWLAFGLTAGLYLRKKRFYNRVKAQSV